MLGLWYDGECMDYGNTNYYFCCRTKTLVMLQLRFICNIYFTNNLFDVLQKHIVLGR